MNTWILISPKQLLANGSNLKFQFLILLFSATFLRAESVWQSQTSKHFEIFVSTGKLGGALIAGLEDMRSKLQVHVAPFAPWFHKEKIKIYIYPDEAAYLNGQFHPPQWSLGIAIAKSRTVAVYQQSDTRKFKTIVLHEITHLLFQDYFEEKPPRWLTEGYAMLMEQDALLTLKSLKDSSLIAKSKNKPPLTVIPLGRFFQETPDRDTPESRTGVWYQQAKSLVQYLYRSRQANAFKELCEHLKKGAPLTEALKSVYGFESVPALEQAWLFYLKTLP